MMRSLIPATLLLCCVILAFASSAQTVHKCTCTNFKDCGTNPYHDGLKWCATNEKCKHDILSHSWDYCETRAEAEAGREMCDVYSERGQHSTCSAARAFGLQGNFVLDLVLMAV